MSQHIYLSIQRLLKSHGVDYELTHHEAVRTSQEAAAVRGLSLEIGAKSIVLKTDDDFRLFVMSAAASMRSRLIRKQLGVRRTRFASAEELLDRTGLEPGAVPPFGAPILPLELYLDPGLLVHERIAFTPGIRTASILLLTEDYLAIARPEVFRFAGLSTSEADRPY